MPDKIKKPLSSTAVQDNTKVKVPQNQLQLKDNRETIDFNRFKQAQLERSNELALRKKGQSSMSNMFHDMGTNMLNNVILQKPTAAEKEGARSGDWGVRSQMMADVVTNILGGELGGAALGGLVGKVAGMGAKKAVEKVAHPNRESIEHFLRTGVGLDQAPKKSLLSKTKTAVQEGVSTITNKKFIPAKVQTLPDKLHFQVEDGFDFGDMPGFSPYKQVKMVDDAGKRWASIDLESMVIPKYDVRGVVKTPDQMTGDDYANITRNLFDRAPWVKPSMIDVNPALRGKKLQDVLYQRGIDEVKRDGMKGIVSGEHLLMPHNTVKAHGRFNRQVFDIKETDGIEHEVAGLTGHKNPNVIQEWLDNYSKMDKVTDTKLSINDVAGIVKKDPKTLVKPTVAAAAAVGAGYGAGTIFKK